MKMGVTHKITTFNILVTNGNEHFYDFSGVTSVIFSKAFWLLLRVQDPPLEVRAKAIFKEQQPLPPLKFKIRIVTCKSEFVVILVACVAQPF